MWLNFIMSVFRGHFALVIYFAKDGKQYICSQLLSIETMIAKFCCFASYHSRLALSYHGTNYIDSSPHDFDIQLDRHFIDIHAYQVFSFHPLPPRPGSIEQTLFYHLKLRNRPIVLF